jgi:hypothetical protein
MPIVIYDIKQSKKNIELKMDEYNYKKKNNELNNSF